jgi:hypothetical protein
LREEYALGNGCWQGKGSGFHGKGDENTRPQRRGACPAKISYPSIIMTNVSL